MAFKLLNNLSDNDNHLTRLTELFEKSDAVLLSSPFLMTDLADFFSEVDLSELTEITLITTLKPNSFDQIKKISSLSTLIEFPEIKDSKIKCRISLNNRLHGKVYIFKKDDNYISAIISSANFTDSGLSRNHEWGVEITDTVEIKALEDSILNSVEISDLTFDEIWKMQDKANEFLENEPQTEVRDIDLNLTSLLAKPNWINELDKNINYWLKPIGVTGDPIPEGALYDALEVGLGDLNFSKMRPTGVKPNDILIAYGVGSTKILSLYKVTSYPEHVTEEEMLEEDWYPRWPWYVNGLNLTPDFGAKWWTHNIYIYSLMEEFLNSDEDGKITAVGGQTLGGLNYGKDKLKLSPEFAMFIIKKVIDLNNNR